MGRPAVCLKDNHPNLLERAVRKCQGDDRARRLPAVDPITTHNFDNPDTTHTSVDPPCNEEEVVAQTDMGARPIMRKP
jgi:hypothetical protein